VCLCALPVKTILEMTYIVSGGMLDPTRSLSLENFNRLWSSMFDAQCAHVDCCCSVVVEAVMSRSVDTVIECWFAMLCCRWTRVNNRARPSLLCHCDSMSDSAAVIYLVIVVVVVASRLARCSVSQYMLYLLTVSCINNCCRSSSLCVCMATQLCLSVRVFVYDSVLK